MDDSPGVDTDEMWRDYQAFFQLPDDFSDSFPKQSEPIYASEQESQRATQSFNSGMVAHEPLEIIRKPLELAGFTDSETSGADVHRSFRTESSPSTLSDLVPAAELSSDAGLSNPQITTTESLSCRVPGCQSQSSFSPRDPK
jgi:hypothetical protein